MATANSSRYPQVDGVPLRAGGNLKAWWASTWTDLYGSGDLRGEDDTIAGKDGVEHRDKQRGPLRAQIQVRVYGDVDSDGDPHAEAWAGLNANLAELEALFVPGLVPVRIFHDDTVYREGDGEVLGGFRPQILNDLRATVVFDLRIPAGRLEAPS